MKKMNTEERIVIVYVLLVSAMPSIGFVLLLAAELTK